MVVAAFSISAVALEALAAVRTALSSDDRKHFFGNRRAFGLLIERTAKRTTMRALRTLALMVVAYAATALILIGVISGGGLWALKASARLLPDTSREKTSFELQLETARDIRQVLATPVPPPAPLPPITAKRANPIPRASVMVEKQRRISPEAREAMAMDTQGQARTFQYQYAPVDRFAPN
jgi:hypothetical protein